MPDEMEMQARRLNEADSALRRFIEIYRAEGYTQDDCLERLDEIWAEDEE